jgi:hypothetical protein
VTSVVVRLSLDFYGKMVFASCVVFTSDLSFSLVSFVCKEVSSLLFSRQSDRYLCSADFRVVISFLCATKLYYPAPMDFFP